MGSRFMAKHLGAVTLVSVWVFRPYAVPLGVLVAVSVVLVWKNSAYLKMFYHDARQRQPNLL